MGIYEDNIVPIKITQLAEYVSKMKRISLDDALVYIYSSPLYKEMYDEGPKWWYLSTPELYNRYEARRRLQRRDIPHSVFEFYTYCLEKYARFRNISGMNAWALFKETQADEYLINNYDLLHTQGVEYLMLDIDEFIETRKR